MSNMYFVLPLNMLLIGNTCLHYRRIEVQRERQLRDAEGEAEKRLIKQSEETDTSIQTVDNKLAELRQQYQQVEADLKTAGDEARQTDSALKVFLQPYCIQCCFCRLYLLLTYSFSLCIIVCYSLMLVFNIVTRVSISICAACDATLQCHVVQLCTRLINASSLWYAYTSSTTVLCTRMHVEWYNVYRAVHN
jgi:hypothetical protein